MSLTFLLFFDTLHFERYSKETASFDKCCHRNLLCRFDMKSEVVT